MERAIDGASATGAGNLDIIHRLQAALRKGDPKEYLEFYAEDVVWHVPGKGGLSGVYRGRAGVSELLQRLKTFAPSPFRILHMSAAAGDDKVFSLHNTKASRPGKRDLDGLEIIMFTLAEGKVVEIRSFLHDLYANDQFWS